MSNRFQNFVRNLEPAKAKDGLKHETNQRFAELLKEAIEAFNATKFTSISVCDFISQVGVEQYYLDLQLEQLQLPKSWPSVMEASRRDGGSGRGDGLVETPDGGFTIGSVKRRLYKLHELMVRKSPAHVEPLAETRPMKIAQLYDAPAETIAETAEIVLPAKRRGRPSKAEKALRAVVASRQ